MNAYPVSRLAQDAGVSVHVVRDYVVRGLVRPARRRPSGYGLFDERALSPLRLVRTLFRKRPPTAAVAGYSRPVSRLR